MVDLAVLESRFGKSPEGRYMFFFYKGPLTCIQMFPENEIQKGMLSMELKRLHKKQAGIVWPQSDLPVVKWGTCKCTQCLFFYTVHGQFLALSDQSLSQIRPLLYIAGFIHDLEGFMDEHPGGERLLRKYIGKDATAAFFGGTYDHSNSAHNVSAPLVTQANLTRFSVTRDEACWHFAWWYTTRNRGEVYSAWSNIAGGSHERAF